MPLRRFSRLLCFFVTGIALALLPSSIAAVVATANPVVAMTGRRVLVLGDSITQDGRYVTFLDYYLHQLAPAENVDVISIGLSSETVSGLSEKKHPFPRPCVLERLDRALKAVKPQVVLACYGMNDGIYHPLSAERLAAFNAGLRQLITQVRASGAQLVLLTPTVFDPLPVGARVRQADANDFSFRTPFAGYDSVLAEFSRAELALHEPGVTVVDLHGPLSTALALHRQTDSAFTFSPDGIHPNDEGHLLIARAILQGLGYTPRDATVAAVMADPLFPLIRDCRQLRSEAWLSFVGYVRSEHYKSASISAAEQVVARLQREIKIADTK